MGVTEEASADVSVGSDYEAGVYCHQGSCIRVFYRLHMNVVPRSTKTQMVEQRINSEV